MRKTLVLLSVASAVAFSAIAPGASAKAGDLTVPGACTGMSTSKLKIGARDGRIETQFEVDQNVIGQTWSVQLKDNGSPFFRGQRTTAAPSGSFEVRAFAANQPGADAISATATNLATGESCSASASI